jgi:hypothetical protein
LSEFLNNEGRGFPGGMSVLAHTFFLTSNIWPSPFLLLEIEGKNEKEQQSFLSYFSFPPFLLNN